MHQDLHQNQKSCTKNTPKNHTKIRIKTMCIHFLSQKTTLPCKIKTGLIFYYQLCLISKAEKKI